MDPWLCIEHDYQVLCVVIEPAVLNKGCLYAVFPWSFLPNSIGSKRILIKWKRHSFIHLNEAK